jgi:hypothetical protein
MFAVIKNNIIIASCETLTDVEFYLQDHPDSTYYEVPEDFKVYEYKVVNGLPVKKTDIDVSIDVLIGEITLQRRISYPPIGDQLDALWKGGEAAAEMLAKVQAVKIKYPKPE